MDYVKKSFIHEDKHNLAVIKTQCHELSPMILVGCGIEFLDSMPMSEHSIDLSFGTEESKSTALKSLNTIINDLTDLRQQMLNHKFKEDVKMEFKGENKNL